MPGEIFPPNYEGWLTPKQGASPYKIIDDAAIIRKKNLIRDSLREEYTKRMYNPYRRAAGVGGFPFDPAIVRYNAMRRHQFEYFRPGPRVWWTWVVGALVPYGTLIYFQERYNRNYEEKIRRGEIPYENREMKVLQMGSKIEYVDSSQIYATKYVRNSKAIGVLWGIFTICYAIINSVAFITQEWIGETAESDNPARFGLWSICYFGPSVTGLEDCQGNLQEVFKFPLSAFSVATIFAIVSVSLALLAVAFLLLFFFCASTSVYRMCGWIQFLSALCLITTIIVYPLGWNSSVVRKTCGLTADIFQPGDCTLRWAFFLAIIGCLDAIVLAILAFILAARHVKLQPEPVYGMNGSLLKGEINNAYAGDIGSTAGSRKSLNLHPVLLMPQPLTDIDRFSELSARTNRSKNSFCRPEFSSNIHNFQL